MDEELFKDLCVGVEEAGAHLRGELDLPEENIPFVNMPDPRRIRANLGLTQEEFAAALEIPINTLRNWEQGRRRPDPAAIKLLKIVERNPSVLYEDV